MRWTKHGGKRIAFVIFITETMYDVNAWVWKEVVLGASVMKIYPPRRNISEWLSVLPDPNIQQSIKLIG